MLFRSAPELAELGGGGPPAAAPASSGAEARRQQLSSSALREDKAGEEKITMKRNGGPRQCPVANGQRISVSMSKDGFF